MHLCRVEGANYQLPDEVVDDMGGLDLESGTTQLNLYGMRFNTRKQKIQVLADSSPRVKVVPQTRVAAKVVRTAGTRKVIVLRVISGSGGERIYPSLSRKQLKDGIFGDPSNPSKCSFKRQYSQCSQGRLNFVPASYRGSAYGVFDLVVATSMKNRAFSLDLQRTVTRAFVAKFGAASQYDHIMFCLPRGINGEFIALATTNDNLSYFSDPWCGSMSSTIHEIGHNMGMGKCEFLLRLQMSTIPVTSLTCCLPPAHSGGLGRGEYDDGTCAMGSSYPSAYAAHRCFNGQKLWAFNWWPTQKKLVDPISNGPWRGHLAAFVDVGSTSMPVVLRVSNLYVVYNRAKKHNSEAQDKVDEVTIVGSPSSTGNSLLRAGINSSPGNNSYSSDAVFEQGRFQVTIEVCKIVKGVGKVDYVELSIRKRNTPSTCGKSRALSAPAPAISALVAPGRLPCHTDSDCSGGAAICALGATGRVCQQGRESRNASIRRRTKSRP